MFVEVFGEVTTMRRNPDLMAEILRYVADESTTTGTRVSVPANIGGASREEVHFHMRLGVDAGLFETMPSPSLPRNGVNITGLTWEGHNVLDKLEQGRPL